jgi:HEAT repeat protein
MKRWLMGIVGFWVSACGPSTLGRVALQEDLPALQAAISHSQQAGELDRDALEDLARALARRELASAQGDSGVARVRDLRPCVKPLQRDFEARAAAKDVVAAAASMALLEAKLLHPEPLIERYATHPDAEWQAVAARAAEGSAQTALRQGFFAHGDLRVRRAALRAAFSSEFPPDIRPLFEVARRDPDPLARSIAVQTLGGIGSNDVVMGLKDLWQTADNRLRQVIVGAWAKPQSYQQGGEAELLWALETAPGLVSLVAARALVVEDGSHRALAVARLMAALKEGTPDERELAIALVPLDAEPRRVLKQLANDAPSSVQVFALARLAEDRTERANALPALKALLKGKDPEVALRARSVLATLGQHEVVELAQAQLSASVPAQRRQAALDLLSVEEYSLAATALGDPVAEVRTSIACTVLTQL